MDRIATLYVFHPLARHGGNGSPRIPVLMYHSISEASDLRHPYFQTTTTPACFAEQMRFLSENGYSAVRLTEAMSSLDRAGAGSTKPVVITFDDGYRDFYTNAFPVLTRYGFAANMFLPTNYIGDQRLRFNGIECLTWKEVRETAAAGMEFGSHTVTHPLLKDLGAAELDYELCRSKETIEDKLGARVDSFAFPFAFPEANRPFVGRLRDTLLRCEYRVGVSTMIGCATAADDRFLLRRLPVNSADDMPLFRAKLEGGYDWLHRLQRLKKTVHKMVAA